jgi:hypothetical protein
MQTEADHTAQSDADRAAFRAKQTRRRIGKVIQAKRANRNAGGYAE